MFALTDPEHGSDVAGGLETTAKEKAMNGLSMVRRNGLAEQM